MVSTAASSATRNTSSVKASSSTKQTVIEKEHDTMYKRGQRLIRSDLLSPTLDEQAHLPGDFWKSKREGVAIEGDHKRTEQRLGLPDKKAANSISGIL